METMMRRSFGARMIGAMRIDTSVYEEVEADTGATRQAAIVVGLVAAASAIGGVGDDKNWIAGIIGAFLGWALWAGVTYLIGSKLFGGTATWGELLRTLGFAMSPGVFYVLGFIPLLGAIVGLVVTIWMLVTGIVAIRQALDFGTGRAVLTALVGFLPYILMRAFAAVLLGT